MTRTGDRHSSIDHGLTRNTEAWSILETPRGEDGTFCARMLCSRRKGCRYTREEGAPAIRRSAQVLRARTGKKRRDSFLLARSPAPALGSPATWTGSAG